MRDRYAQLFLDKTKENDTYMIKYTCPCCGYKTLAEKPGNSELCPICFWEDDPFQSSQADLESFANKVSLIQAQQNFIKFGSSDERVKNKVRKPNIDDIKDPNWNPLVPQK